MQTYHRYYVVVPTQSGENPKTSFCHWLFWALKFSSWITNCRNCWQPDKTPAVEHRDPLSALKFSFRELWPRQFHPQQELQFHPPELVLVPVLGLYMTLFPCHPQPLFTTRWRAIDFLWGQYHGLYTKYSVVPSIGAAMPPQNQNFLTGDIQASFFPACVVNVLLVREEGGRLQFKNFMNLALHHSFP